MAILQPYSGSASIGTTEYDLPSSSTTLSSLTTDGVYQLFLDLSSMVSTDEYRLRIYEKVRTTSTQRLVEEIIISGSQPEPVFVTPSILLLHGWTMTLTLTSGSAKIIEWSIRQVA